MGELATWASWAFLLCAVVFALLAAGLFLVTRGRRPVSASEELLLARLRATAREYVLFAAGSAFQSLALALNLTLPVGAAAFCLGVLATLLAIAAGRRKPMVQRP